MQTKRARGRKRRRGDGKGKQLSLPLVIGARPMTDTVTPKRRRSRRKKGRGRIRPVRIVKVRTFMSKVLGRRVSATEIGLPVITFVFDESDPNCELFAEIIGIKRK